MTNILVFDVETTGLPKWHEPSEDPGQPHIVQWAAILCDPEGGNLASLNIMSEPEEGWVFEEDAVKAHGITPEIAAAAGVPEKEALEVFLSLAGKAGLRCGHNVSFDIRLIRIAMKRYGFKDEFCDAWKTEMPSFCTQRETIKLCNLPPSDAMKAKNMKAPKPPQLGEAYARKTGTHVHIA